jgi:Domain of unknown function (DUF4397)
MKKSMTAGLLSVVAFAGTAALAPTAEAARPAVAGLVVVQAVPGEVLDVAIDGRTVRRASEVGSVLGPFSVPAGHHQVTFRDAQGGMLLATGVDLEAGSRQDLVVHLPADVGGVPVANLYRTPTASIGADKARVLIAHTATVAPADVRVDGTVVFRNIANGEFAVADVPAGSHVAELLPTGLTGRPILGPLKVTLPAETATMVYAIGDPTSQSMRIVAHSVSLAASGVEAPRAINTGRAGLAADIEVVPFSAVTPGAVDDRDQRTPATIGAALAALFGLGFAQALRTRRRRAIVSRG